MNGVEQVPAREYFRTHATWLQGAWTLSISALVQRGINFSAWSVVRGLDVGCTL